MIPNGLRNRIVGHTPPGTEVTRSILRDRHEQQVHARLTSLSESSDNAGGASRGNGSGNEHAQLGIAVEPLKPDLARQFGL